MSSLIYGIDFGTTNSAVAVYKQGKVKMVPLNGTNKMSTRTVLYYPPDMSGYLVGDRALKRYANDVPRGRFIHSFKAILPDESFEGTQINYKWVEIEDLVALVLDFLKKEADEYTGQSGDRLVLGRPARFSENEQEDQLANQRLIKAAHKAGFKEISLQIEPIAAALKYEATLKKPQLVLVADFGGGTTDFTLMRLSPDSRHSTDRSQDIMGTSGVYIGGDKFNSLIMIRRLVKYFGAEAKYKSWDNWLDVPPQYTHGLAQWHKISFLKHPREREFIGSLIKTSTDPDGFKRLATLVDENLAFSFFQAIETAKCQLSSSLKTNFEYSRSQIEIIEEITRQEFTKMISEELAKINNCLTQLLDSSNLDEANIDAVFMTGGSSLVPGIQELFGKRFGKRKIKFGDTFLSVVNGLALSSPLFFK